MNILENLLNYTRSAYSAVFVQTHEERRFIDELRELISTVKDTKGLKADGWQNEQHVMGWCTSEGLIHYNNQGPIAKEMLTRTSRLSRKDTQPLSFFLEWLWAEVTLATPYLRRTLIIIRDFPAWEVKDAVRMLRSLWPYFQSLGITLVFVGHSPAKIPAELSKEIHLTEYKLPDTEALSLLFDNSLISIKEACQASEQIYLEPSDAVRELVIEAAKGLTSTEASNAFAFATIQTRGEVSPAFAKCVFEEKVAQLRRSGLLSHEPVNVSFENVGGHGKLKKWIASRKKAYSQSARDYKLPLPKGILLASVPGAGNVLVIV